MSVEKQSWNPPYEVVEVPSDRVKLAFPKNYFSVTIIDGSFQFSISTDLAALPAIIARMEKLLEFAELGPMPQAQHEQLTGAAREPAAELQPKLDAEKPERTLPIMPSQRGGLVRAEQKQEQEKC